MKRNMIRKLLPLLGFVILGIIIVKIDLASLWQVLKNTRIGLLLFLPLVIALVFLLQTCKWYLILKKQNLAVRFPRLYRLILIGIFYGSITPGQLGGLIKIKYLSDTCQKSKSECSSSVILDKAIDFLSLCLFASVGSIILAKRFGLALIPIGFTLFSTLVLFILLYKSQWLPHIMTVFPFTLIPQKIRVKLSDFFMIFSANLPQTTTFVFPLILLLISIASWLLIYTQIFIISRAVSIELGYFPFVFLIPLSSLIALVPITINGIGTKEAVLILILSLYGASPEQIVGMSLLNLILCIYLPALAGGLLSLKTLNPQTGPVSSSPCVSKWRKFHKTIDYLVR